MDGGQDMSMVGKQTDVTVSTRDAAEVGRGRAWRPIVIGALVLGVVAGGVVGARAIGGDGNPAPSASTGAVDTSNAAADGTSAGTRLVSYDLERLVAEADRIVVGTVTDVQHGKASELSGGMDYVLGTLKVEELIRGAKSTDQIVAFDFEYGNAVVSDTPMGATFEPGQRVLVFLTSVAGTVSEDLRPEHWQVTGGDQGEFFFEGDKLQAPFSLEDVREAAAQVPSK
jgi:hypothetical protein